MTVGVLVQIQTEYPLNTSYVTSLSVWYVVKRTDSRVSQMKSRQNIFWQDY